MMDQNQTDTRIRKLFKESKPIVDDVGLSRAICDALPSRGGGCELAFSDSPDVEARSPAELKGAAKRANGAETVSPRPGTRALSRPLVLAALSMIALAVVGFGTYALVEQVGRNDAVVVITDDSMSPSGPSEPTETNVSGTIPVTSPEGPQAVIGLSVPEASPVPEELFAVGWGVGAGEVSLGQSQFGTSGPDTLAVSPDGKTIAVYDRYADPAHVNLYTSDGEPVGEVWLKSAPAALAVSNDREVYDAGLPSASGDIEDLGREFPLPSGRAWLRRDDAEHLLLTVAPADVEAVSALLVLPPELADAAAFVDESTAGGLPVVALFLSDPEGGPSTSHYVAVDVDGGKTSTATVVFDWNMPGGDAYVGSDGVYVMSLDPATGVTFLRVPFISSAYGSKIHEEQSRRLAEAVAADGFEVISASLMGQVASLQVRQTTQPSDRLSNTVQLDRVYKRAAELGVKSLHIKLERRDGTSAEVTTGMRPNNVERANAEEATQAAVDWVDSVAAEKGVQANVTFDPVEYQADVTVSGPLEKLAFAVEAFMNGGRGLHDSGYIEVVTVRATVEGRVVFEGVSNWVVDHRLKVFQAPEFQVEY